MLCRFSMLNGHTGKDSTAHSRSEFIRQGARSNDAGYPPRRVPFLLPKQLLENDEGSQSRTSVPCQQSRLPRHFRWPASPAPSHKPCRAYRHWFTGELSNARRAEGFPESILSTPPTRTIHTVPIVTNGRVIHVQHPTGYYKPAIIACGAISGASDTKAGAVINHSLIFKKVITVHGFLYGFGDEAQKALGTFDADTMPLVASGKITSREHRYQGLREMERA
ncbi:hypothetical protein NLI96_g7907 [Meripilus lineatus]|uniref:Uncharacterized protein n=1 Tax=Meripilus lineatus TaxID=2056292 RepID=A0AAD5UYA5_9APHY|nr:hypothetical protein NLI96_g7907 [Physisporinus lineatus]